MATNWDKLLSREELQDIAKEKKKLATQEKVSSADYETKLANGYREIRRYKNGTFLMEKDKPIGDAFEDEVWSIFYNMGFEYLNADRHFVMYNGDSVAEHKQIDIIAVDSEVCLLIECKATATLDNQKTWKTDLESINFNLGWLRNEVLSKFPGRKIKYCFATKNYILGDADLTRLKSWKIANFDYDTVRYYSGLVEHLGQAAKYQLLGSIFAGLDIAGMEERIPAIEGKMGGKTYYSFVIEPERMLKLSYILHRNKANYDNMPTYQRLIKKSRLLEIREFVNNSGYFPNSIIVSIDTNGRGLRFDQLQTRIPGCHSKVGTLYLPKKYMSAYVIDGQHRLYGYSGSNHAENNSIPVVAFLDLPKGEQVKMFMDINEKQKQVPKSLRNTLNINLLWDSAVYNERKESLMLSIGQSFGEKQNSPLYGRVVTGEDSSDRRCCITLDFIRDALKQSDFLNVYKKNNQIIKEGTFDKTDNTETDRVLYPFLTYCFSVIKDYCSEEWNNGNEGFLTINNTIYSLIMIFSDILNIVLHNENKQKGYDVDDLEEKCEPFLLALADTINHLTDEEKSKIKGSYGGGGKKLAWRTLQVALHTNKLEYINDDLQKFIDENCADNNPNASDYIYRIKMELIERLKGKVSDEYDLIDNYCSSNHQSDLESRIGQENGVRRRKNQEDVTIWEIIGYKDILELIRHQNNWSTLLKDILTSESLSKTKTETIDWLKSLEQYEKMVSAGQSILTSQFREIETIFRGFFPEQNAEETVE